jgi:hypothetical protein
VSGILPAAACLHTCWLSAARYHHHCPSFLHFQISKLDAAGQVLQPQVGDLHGPCLQAEARLESAMPRASDNMYKYKMA